MDKLSFIRFINIKCLVKTNFFPTFAEQKDKNDTYEDFRSKFQRCCKHFTERVG